MPANGNAPDVSALPLLLLRLVAAGRASLLRRVEKAAALGAGQKLRQVLAELDGAEEACRDGQGLLDVHAQLHGFHPPRHAVLLQDGGVGVVHHGDEEVQQQDRPQHHVDEVEDLGEHGRTAHGGHGGGEAAVEEFAHADHQVEDEESRVEGRGVVVGHVLRDLEDGVEGGGEGEEDEEVDEEELEDVLDDHVLDHPPEVVDDADAAGEGDGVQPPDAHGHGEHVVHIRPAHCVQRDPDDHQHRVDQPDQDRQGQVHQPVRHLRFQEAASHLDKLGQFPRAHHFQHLVEVEEQDDGRLDGSHDVEEDCGCVHGVVVGA